MTDPDVTVILPAYNEEKRLEKCIKETRKTFDDLSIKYEIIIAENGSMDNTFKLAQKFSLEYPFIRTFHLDIPSIGAALRKGYEVAKGKVVVNLDVDLATDMSHIKELLQYSQHYDIVTGSRYLEKKIVNRTFRRLFLSKVFNWILIRGLLGSKIKDNNCGFRALKRDIGVKLFNEVENDDVFGLVELLVLAQRHNYKIKEFPVHWKENPRKISFNNIMRFLIPSLKLWWKLSFRKNTNS